MSLITFSTTPIIPHPKLSLLLWQKQKKSSPTVPHLTIYPKLGKTDPARVYMRAAIRGASFWITASPSVCQILLGKSCVLPTSKKICKVKKSSQIV
jgi:hypothetical protein